jgi:hypothetical protein
METHKWCAMERARVAAPASSVLLPLLLALSLLSSLHVPSTTTIGTNISLFSFLPVHASMWVDSSDGSFLVSELSSLLLLLLKQSACSPTHGPLQQLGVGATHVFTSSSCPLSTMIICTQL